MFMKARDSSTKNIEESCRFLHLPAAVHDRNAKAVILKLRLTALGDCKSSISAALYRSEIIGDSGSYIDPMSARSIHDPVKCLSVRCAYYLTYTDYMPHPSVC
ncbi:hypothetical protein Tcan_00677, partial [Toxocara canis]